MISGSVSCRASSNSLRAFSRSTSRLYINCAAAVPRILCTPPYHMRPFSSRQTKSNELRQISRYLCCGSVLSSVLAQQAHFTHSARASRRVVSTWNGDVSSFFLYRLSCESVLQLCVLGDARHVPGLTR